MPTCSTLTRVVLPLVLLAVPLRAGTPRELFPTPEPLQTGYLDVGDGHEVFFATFGNPQGKPVFVLHGGPGYGSYPRLAQYFDPAKFFIVLHDQRGAGRSRPAGEIRANTTAHLVADIERLRRHLNIDGKILVFGGSWGSTLALAYAEAHPEQVAGLILRGVFTGTKAETEHVFGEGAARLFFPDAVARLERELPAGFKFEPAALLAAFNSGDDETTGRIAAAWIRYGVKTGKLHATDEEVESGWGDYDARAGARIDAHYAVNGYFVEEGQLLRDADRLKNISTTIINGRYDAVCPPVTAWKLHERLPQSKCVIVEEAGHSEGEPGTTQALLEAVAAWE